MYPPGKHNHALSASMGLVVLLIVFGLLVLIVLPIWVLVKINAFSTENEVLQSRLAAVEYELKELRQKLA